MRLRLARAGAALIGVALVTTACSSAEPVTATTDEAGSLVVDGEVIAAATLYEAAKAEGVVSLYTAYLQDVAERYTAEFTQQTGIDVEFVRLTPTQLQERAISEGGSKLLAADVLQTSDPLNIGALVDAGVVKCEVLDARFTETIDEGYLDPEGCAYPATVSTMVIAYNTAALGDTPPPETLRLAFLATSETDMVACWREKPRSTASLRVRDWSRSPERWGGASSAGDPPLSGSDSGSDRIISLGRSARGRVPP